tara:strand:- start:19875 stop:21389 length:1515 start_codon:yes stop_codon:yes gene_type:complete
MIIYLRLSAFFFALVLLVPTVFSSEKRVSASQAYRSVLSDERAARKAGTRPRLNELRTLIASYEQIFYENPESEFINRALWQASGLAVEAYDWYRQPQDFKAGHRILNALGENRGALFHNRIKERRSLLNELNGTALLRYVERRVHSESIQVIIHLDRAVTYKTKILEKPNRLYFDLIKTDTVAKFRNTKIDFKTSHKDVYSIRLGSHPNRTTRVVIDTRSPEKCKISTEKDPNRLIAKCSVPPHPKTVAPKHFLVDKLPFPEDLSVARQLGLKISRIVLDPGHGGRDPGAQASGLDEASVVLKIAKRLKKLITDRTDIEVVMTREDNRFLSLGERTQLANDVNADLFLSIHANANRNSTVRGLETYFLNFTTDPIAEELAARENSSGNETMRDLDSLLQTIATNSKVNESQYLASIIQKSLVKGIQSVDPHVPDLGVKQAPFRVLIGARMPSILAELLFLTNKKDAQLLSDKEYLDHVAESLFSGIMHYQHSLSSELLLAEGN